MIRTSPPLHQPGSAPATRAWRLFDATWPMLVCAFLASSLFCLEAQQRLADTNRVPGRLRMSPPAPGQSVRSQSPQVRIAVPPPGTAAVPGAIPPPGTPVQQAAPAEDPLNLLMQSAASIDVDSPVTVQAEFDPPTVAMGGRAVYRVMVTALNESVTLPDNLPIPPGLEMTQGGRAHSYQPAGARMQPRTTINFRVTPKMPGLHVMPAFTLTAYGKPVRVPEARINVIAQGAPGLREPARLLVDLPNTPMYVGQTVRIRIILPDPGDNTLFGITQPRIASESFLTEPAITGQRRETVQRDGKVFLAHVQDLAVTPIAGGEQTLVAQAHAVSTRMNPAQAGVFATTQILVDSDPVKVTIQSLPREGRLAGFTGAIGQFQLDPPTVSSNQVRAGEVVHLAVTVRGNGNIGRLTPPPPPFVKDWQVFPALADPSPAYLVQQRPSNTFTYTLIPLSERVRATPAIPFSFFDPKQGHYVDLTVPPVPVTVLPPKPGADLQALSANTAPPPEDSGGPERELFLTGLMEHPGNTLSTLVPSQQRAWFLLLQCVPAGVLAGLWAWDRRRRWIERNPELVLRRKARRELIRELKAARNAARARDSKQFLAAALAGLRAACAPRLSANPRALVCADVMRELPAPEREASAPLVRRLFHAADAVHARPAQPTSANGIPTDDSLVEIWPDLERLLRRLHSNL